MNRQQSRIGTNGDRVAVLLLGVPERRRRLMNNAFNTENT